MNVEEQVNTAQPRVAGKLSSLYNVYMIATSILLVKPAKQAGIVVPDDPTQWNEKDPKYLRWTIFCNVQIGQSLPEPTAHWDNAQVIAKIPQEQLTTITIAELITMGFKAGTTLP